MGANGLEEEVEAKGVAGDPSEVGREEGEYLDRKECRRFVRLRGSLVLVRDILVRWGMRGEVGKGSRFVRVGLERWLILGVDVRMLVQIDLNFALPKA